MNKLKKVLCIYRKECVLGLVLLFCICLIVGVGYYSYMKEDSVEFLVDSMEMSSSVVKDIETSSEEVDSGNENMIGEIEDKKIRVDIKGQVMMPGVYEVASDDRVIDVISKAGGLLDTADTSVNNLSRRVWDEMVIIIYSKDEVENFTLTKEVESEELLNSSEVKDIILNDATLKEEDILTNQDNGTLDNNETSNKGESEKEIISDVVSNTPETEKNSKVSINTATISELMKLSGIGQAKAEEIINYRNTNGNFLKLEDLMKVKGIGEKIFAKIKNNITL